VRFGEIGRGKRTVRHAHRRPSTSPLSIERKELPVPAPIHAVEWSQGIEEAWADVATFVPKLGAFLVVLVLGYLIAKAIAKVADRALERVGFDRAVERGGIKQALAKSKYDASDIVGKVIFYALFLMVLQLAFGVFGDNPVSDLITGVIAYLPKVFAAIVIVVVASAVAAAARELIQASLGGLPYGSVLGNVAGLGIVTVGVFMALSQLEIAPAIVNGLFYGLLAVIVGSTIVAIGGGGIQPMRERWEHALTRYDEEMPRMREEMQGARDRIEDRAEEIKGKASTSMTTSTDTARSKPAQAR
jgi:hypothetical protein